MIRLSICNNLNVNGKLRTTFNMKNAWIKELRDDKILKVENVNGEDNIADIFTKPISGSKVQEKLIRCNPIQIIT